ncbi:antibiotic resistance protein VanZ [Exiguobacterium sp. s59]|uniref:antibiotic resistance protein VanZ n=1 Tax=Exiguobacterium sp. s59 TaxID=2751269 RepID=UPI0020372990|nr:antibiotic resistance protein VanZ [Exiguobacterium sp. s59]
MFYGTKFYYKILYFLTAMSPAYLLFLLQFHSKFKVDVTDITIWNIKFNVIYVLIATICIMFILSIILSFLIKHQYFSKSNTRIYVETIHFFKEHKLKEINGTVTTFLLGVIIPSIFIIETDPKIALGTFIFLQFLIYKIIMKSTDIFPNVVLIIFGINLCKTQEDNYVFTFKSKKYNEFVVYKIGDPNKSRMYITMYEK